jgi:Multicopper oxidase
MRANAKEIYLMNTDMDMTHTDNEEMDAGASDLFSRDTMGLADTIAPQVVVLQPDEVFELRAEQVRKRINDATVKMLAYNRSIPGPTLRVAQGSEVTVRFTNQADLDTTVHWHGLRLENRFDGVPMGAHQGIMAPVAIGGSFTYRLRFPDAGLYWYHPHLREDYTQELGLYAPIIVVPTDAAYWSPANREVTLILDDLLLEDDKIAPFSRTLSDHTAMGRFGNVMLVNGETSPTIAAMQGEVVRLYLLNTANVRVFNVRLPGARMKLVGADNGRVEREEFVEEVLLSPSERVILDVFFERAGQFSLEHRTPERTYPLATVSVEAQPVEHSFAPEFFTLRTSPELTAERFWIIHAPENVPSGAGMHKAGLYPIGQLSFRLDGGVGLAPLGSPEHAQAGALLLGIPLVEIVLAPCWCCGGLTQQRVNPIGAQSCWPPLAPHTVPCTCAIELKQPVVQEV